MKKPKVGQTVYSIKGGGRNEPQTVKEHTVTKSGNLYFEIEGYRNKFQISTGRIISDFSSGMALYEYKHEAQSIIEQAEATTKLNDMNWSDWNKIPLYKLQEIIRLITNP